MVTVQVAYLQNTSPPSQNWILHYSTRGWYLRIRNTHFFENHYINLKKGPFLLWLKYFFKTETTLNCPGRGLFDELYKRSKRQQHLRPLSQKSIFLNEVAIYIFIIKVVVNSFLTMLNYSNMQHTNSIFYIWCLIIQVSPSLLKHESENMTFSFKYQIH
jgi:hypothetical protein